MNKYVWEGYDKNDKVVCGGEVVAKNTKEATKKITENLIENIEKYKELGYYYYHMIDVITTYDTHKGWMLKCNYLWHDETFGTDSEDKRTEGTFYFDSKEELCSFVKNGGENFRSIIVIEAYRLDYIDKEELFLTLK